jgi:hypothetical protein
MKPLTVLAVSLALNGALVAVFLLKPALAPAMLAPALPAHAASPTAAVAAPTSTVTSKLWPRLASDDTRSLVASLRAIGCPPENTRQIVTALISAQFRARGRALTEPDAGTPYWKTSPTGLPTGPRLEEYTRLQRERSQLLRELTAELALDQSEVTPAQARRYGNLPRSKIDQVQRIEADYDDLINAVRTGSAGLLLPEDRAKLGLLAQEKKKDLAGVLNPAELAEYEMRTSSITRLIGYQLGDFRPTEAEFRAIYALEKTINEQFPTKGLGPNSTPGRREAQIELNQQLREKLGDARYNEYARGTSPEYQQLRKLVEQDQLPADVGVRAFDLRNSVSRESMRIVNDTALAGDEKRTLLANLAVTTRNQLLTLLGPTSGPTYVKLADEAWLRTLERGAAVTFDGPPSRSTSNDEFTVSLGVAANPHFAPPPRR